MRRDAGGNTRSYSTRRAGTGAHLEARWNLGAEGRSAKFGTVEHFLLERYLLYVERKDGLHVGQVHHTPYPTTEVELGHFEETLTRAAGLTPLGAPAFVHASPGVDVEVFSTRRV